MDKCKWSTGGMIIMEKIIYVGKNWLHCRVTISDGGNKRTSAIQVYFL